MPPDAMKMDRTVVAVTALIAFGFMSLVAAFWHGTISAQKRSQQIASECVTAGGSAVVISGEMNCLRLAQPKQ